MKAKSRSSEVKRITIGILTVLAIAVIIAALMLLGIVTITMLLFNPWIFVILAIVIVFAYYVNKESQK